MWPFKKKKPEKYPVLVLHGIGQRIVFPPHKEVFIVREITCGYHFGESRLSLEAIDQEYLNTHYTTPKGDNLLDMF